MLLGRLTQKKALKSLNRSWRFFPDGNNDCNLKKEVECETRGRRVPIFKVTVVERAMALRGVKSWPDDYLDLNHSSIIWTRPMLAFPPVV